MYLSQPRDLIASMPAGCSRGTMLLPQMDRFTPLRSSQHASSASSNECASESPIPKPTLSSDRDRVRLRGSPSSTTPRSSDEPERRHLTLVHGNPDQLPRDMPGSDSRSMSRWFRSQHFQAVWERLDSGTCESRPPHPYTELIKLCILKRREGKLTLNELYRDLQEKFPFFALPDNKGWKNTLRHNLSTQPYFIKLDREHGQLGKGHYWAYCPDLEKPTSLAQSSVVQLSSLWPPSVSAASVPPREESAREYCSATEFQHAPDYLEPATALPRFEDYNFDKKNAHELPRVHHPPTQRSAHVETRSSAYPISMRRLSSPARNLDSSLDHPSNQPVALTRMRSATISSFSRPSDAVPSHLSTPDWDPRRSSGFWSAKDATSSASPTSSFLEARRGSNPSSSTCSSSSGGEELISRLPPLPDLPPHSAPARKSLGDYYLSNPISRR